MARGVVQHAGGRERGRAVARSPVFGTQAEDGLPFETLIREAGGGWETGADVERVIVERGRAVGVLLAGGHEVRAGEVICNVTPT